MPYKNTKCFDAKKYLNAVSTLPVEQNVFGEKKCLNALKNGIQWVIDQKNMVDVFKTHFPSQWASAMSS